MANFWTKSPTSPEAPGFLGHSHSLLASLAAYLRPRLELAGLESREALGTAALTLFFLLSALGLLLFGYIFLWVGLLALAAHCWSFHWGWLVLGMGVFHGIGALGCLWIAKKKWRKPLFSHTLDELKKDEEWLNHTRKTEKPS